MIILVASAEFFRAKREAHSLAASAPATTRTSYDIVGTFVQKDIPVFCAPLKGIMGASVTFEDVRGVLLSTKYPLPVQRFTLAHELGHIVLSHQLKFDASVGTFIGRHHGVSGASLMEATADAFAAELLAGEPRVHAIRRQQKWGVDDLSHPIIAYQMALRLGVSFDAACRSLLAHKLISQAEWQRLDDLQPKQIKRDILGAPPPSPYADVWLISENDTGTTIEAGSQDVFCLDVEERPSSGYIWEMASDPSEVTISQRLKLGGGDYGETIGKVFHVQFRDRGLHPFCFARRRPWSGEQSATIAIEIDNWGRESGGGETGAGFTRREREHRLATAGASA